MVSYYKNIFLKHIRTSNETERMTKPIVRQKKSRILSASSDAMIPEPKRRGDIYKFMFVSL